MKYKQKVSLGKYSIRKFFMDNTFGGGYGDKKDMVNAATDHRMDMTFSDVQTEFEREGEFIVRLNPSVWFEFNFDDETRL